MVKDFKDITVAYIGNFEPEFSTENDVRKAFESLGVKVFPLQENRLNWDVLNRFEYDMLLITGTWDEVNPLADMLTLYKKCADHDIPTATLHLDTFWGTSRDNRRWWLSPMFHTSHIFTADGDYDDKWKLLGKNHVWLPPGVRHDAVGVGQFRDEYVADVGFAGSCGVGYHEDVWTYRKELIDTLREICSRRGWSFSNPGGELDKPDNGKIPRDQRMNDWYASVKVTVGDSLCLFKEKSRYWSDRVPEATGRSGFLIMPQIDELEKMYGGELEMYPWGDFKVLEDKIEYWLSHDLERKAKVLANHKETASNHTYVNRVKTVMEIVGL